MSDPVTICNSSPLIALDAIGQLELLHNLYGSIAVPNAVATEWGLPLPAWIAVATVINTTLVGTLGIQIGPGEAEAIALALEVPTQRIILDDKKARNIAKHLGLPLTGTVAVIVQAKSAGLVSNVRDVLDALAQSGFRISQTLYDTALQNAGE